MKPSHRTGPELGVGLGIFLLLGFAFSTFSPLASSFWGIFYTLFISLSTWFLWRSYSIKKIKLELSVFASQFVLQGIWRLISEESLLSLLSLLLIWCNLLMLLLLFWKKEKIAGCLLLYPLGLFFFFAAANMLNCITNP